VRGDEQHTAPVDAALARSKGAFEVWTCSRCGGEVANAQPLEDGSIVCDACLDKEYRTERDNGGHQKRGQQR
jgi:formylmethanofuran dehydrogenase subunit E